MSSRREKNIYFLSPVLFCLVLLFFLLSALPLYPSRDGAGEFVLLNWASGGSSRVLASELYGAYVGVDGAGDLRFERNGAFATVAGSDGFRAACAVADGGNLLELVTLDVTTLSRLERFAFYRLQRDRLWYAGECFAWTGTKIERVKPREAEEIVLLEGELPLSVLLTVRPSRLRLKGEAQLTGEVFLAGSITQVIAEPPYFTDGEVVYLDTPSGRRLLSAVSGVRSLEVEEVGYMDEGALSACQALEELSVIFVGNAYSSHTSEFVGQLAYLFSTSDGFFVPPTLKRVRVRGGTIASHAFYLCERVEEIDACGVDPELIAEDAFVDCTGLRLLHTPRADVSLQGPFTATIAPCGCTVYERTDIK